MVDSHKKGGMKCIYVVDDSTGKVTSKAGEDKSSNPDIPELNVHSSKLSSTFPKKNPTAHG